MAETDVKEKTPEQVAKMEEAMQKDGVATHESMDVDYFAFDQTERVTLPDGKQWIEHKLLNEGQRRKYLNTVNKDVTLQRATGNAVIQMAPGEEKKALLMEAVVGWSLMRGGEPVAFSKPILDQFLDKAPPHIIDHIEKAIRKANKWLNADMTVEDIDKEIVNLEEMKKNLLKEQEGKDGSSSK